MRLIDADVLPEISLFGTTEYINVRKAPTVPAVPLDRIKEAREKIKHYKHGNGNIYTCGLNKAVEILDKLIAESER